MAKSEEDQSKDREQGKPEKAKPEKGKAEKGKAEKGKPDKGKPDKGKPDKGKPEKGKPAEPEPKVVPRLWEKYDKQIRARLAEKLGRSNALDLPRLKKIVVNMGVGSAVQEKKHLEEAVSALSQVTGQRPAVTLSRQSIAGFRLREGMQIGCRVTLRGARMYEFLDRLVSLALPRVRDFRGLNPEGFDGNGNYNLGLSEQLVFPEINPDKFTRTQGMNVTIVISGGSDDESRELLRELGMPFRV
jgi:large subunit ribosomal protein L5